MKFNIKIISLFLAIGAGAALLSYELWHLVINRWIADQFQEYLCETDTARPDHIIGCYQYAGESENKIQFWADKDGSRRLYTVDKSPTLFKVLLKKL